MTKIKPYRPSKRVRATVITDASWCPQTKAGGWASWVTMSSGRIKRAGLFKELAGTPTQAELWAALNGIWYAVEAGATDILVQTDCQGVVDQINKATIPDLRYFKGLNIIARHVRGHTKVDDSRSFVNRWCDTEAKVHMRKQRADIRNHSDYTAEGFY